MPPPHGEREASDVCGIGGIVHRDQRPCDSGALDRMSEAMRERGPDDTGSWAGPGVGLVHRRLSILDLSAAGRCPMGNDDGSVQVVHNGEIYNFLDLRADLERRGHRFRSRCDSEVVVRGYEEWGTDLVPRLDGMFAFAVWDAKAERLLLARDRTGEKPLYVRERPDGLVFASTLMALHAFEDGAVELDAEGFDCFLSHGFIPAPHTIWRGVRALEPSHLAVVERGGALRVERYWDFPSGPAERMDVAEAEARVEDALERSVKSRLLADVPIGGFLSGGVDSSLVMALAARHSPAIRTFAIGFEETDFSELPHARTVARAIGSTHEERIVKEDDLLAIVPRLVWHYGQPFGDASAIPTHLVSEFTRGHVKVALSGDGGDESFAGYWRAEAHSYASQFRRLVPEALRRGAVPALCGAAERLGLGGPAARLRALNALSLGPPGAGYTDALCWFSRRSELTGETLGAQLRASSHDPAACRTGHEPPAGSSPLRQVLYDDFQALLPNDYLVKVDVASMAASLEVRPPFLDHHFLETAWAVPDGMKLRLGRRKWLLKRIAAKHVPSEVIYRRKSGFALPLVHWWRGRLAGVLRHLLPDSRCVAWGWIERGPVEACLDAHVAGRSDHHMRLWLVLWLELWARIVVEGSMPRDASLLDLE